VAMEKVQIHISDASRVATPLSKDYSVRNSYIIQGGQIKIYIIFSHMMRFSVMCMLQAKEEIRVLYRKVDSLTLLGKL
jgi:hypothetical protein